MAFDHFSGAQPGWRTEAKIRARRVVGERIDDPIGYVDGRVHRAHIGSFERRRWSFIRKLVVRFLAEEEQRLRPAKPQRRTK